MCGEKIPEQAAVQKIDRERAGDNIGAALRVIALEHFRAAEILALLVRVGHDFGDRGRIANAEIETLRADWRHDMRGFADKHNPIAGKSLGGLYSKRKYATSRFDDHRPQQRMIAALRGDHADQARSAAGQRHQREWTFLGMEFSRRILVRPRMRKIERERGLRVSATPRHDPGRSPAHRARTVGSDRKLYTRLAVGIPDGDARSRALDRQRRRGNRL